MSNTSLTLSPAAQGGGAVSATIIESLWLGGTRFFVVFGQTGTAPGTYAQIIDIAGDPYAGSAPGQSVTASLQVSTSPPKDPPRLIRLDAGKVLMFWSATNLVDSFGTTTTLAFDAVVIEINGNVPTVTLTQTGVAPAAFMNFTAGAVATGIAPTTTKALSAAGTSPNTPNYTYPNSWSAVLSISADGVATNRVLIVTRNTSRAAAPVSMNATLWDVRYTSGSPATLSIVSRFTGANTTYGGNAATYVGPNDFPYIYTLPATTSVLIGYVNHDPYDGAVNGAVTNPYINRASTTAFLANNPVYVFDYTQGATTWTATNAILTARRAAVMAPLDSDRMLELGNQMVTGFNEQYGRVYSLSAGTWSGDLPLDASIAVTNKNGSLAFGLINQVTMLGADHFILGLSTRPPAVNTAGVGYFGIYKVVGTSAVVSSSYGVPVISPILNLRGQDAIIPRTVAEPTVTGNPASYDFFARTSVLGYRFLRYTNPM